MTEQSEKEKAFRKIAYYIIGFSSVLFVALSVINSIDADEDADEKEENELSSHPSPEVFFGTFEFGPIEFPESNSGIGWIRVISEQQAFSALVPLTFSAKRGDKLPFRWYEFRAGGLTTRLPLVIETEKVPAYKAATALCEASGDCAVESKSSIKNLNATNRLADDLAKSMMKCMPKCKDKKCLKCFQDSLTDIVKGSRKSTE